MKEAIAEPTVKEGWVVRIDPRDGRKPWIATGTIPCGFSDAHKYKRELRAHVPNAKLRVVRARMVISEVARG